MRIVLVDGTPEELEHASWLKSLLDEGEIATPASGGVSGGAERLPNDVRTFLNARLPNGSDERRLLAERFLEGVLTFGPDIQMHPGRSSETSDGFTRYVWAKRGQTKALLYFRPLPGVVQLDLSPEDVVHYGNHVETRDRKSYRVFVHVSDEQSLEDALALARKAYEQAAKSAA